MFHSISPKVEPTSSLLLKSVTATTSWLRGIAPLIQILSLTSWGLSHHPLAHSHTTMTTFRVLLAALAKIPISSNVFTLTQPYLPSFANTYKSHALPVTTKFSIRASAAVSLKYVNQEWFCTPYPPPHWGSFDNVWRQFLVVTTWGGECYWHLVGKGVLLNFLTMHRTVPCNKEVSSLKYQQRRGWKTLLWEIVEASILFWYLWQKNKTKRNKTKQKSILLAHTVEPTVLSPTPQLKTGENKQDLVEPASSFLMWVLLSPGQELGKRGSIWAEESIQTNGFQTRLHHTSMSFQIF